MLLTKDGALLARPSDDMHLSGLAFLIPQALCQTGLGKGVFGEKLAIVHDDWVLQNDVVLICDQDVMDEAESASLCDMTGFLSVLALGSSPGIKYHNCFC